MSNDNGRSNPSRAAGEAAPQLMLKAPQAAKALGIGQRKLWELTNMGEIPHMRIGRAVRYPVASLEAWIAKESNKRHRR